MNRFEYKGFNPTLEMEEEAQEVIEEIQDHAPRRVAIAALLHHDGKRYHCLIDAFLRRGSISASVSDTEFSVALTRAKEIVLEKLAVHQETKFFTRKPEALTKQTVI